MSPDLAVMRAEFPHCAACGHCFIDHPSSNEVVDGLNAKMQLVYMESMATMTPNANFDDDLNLREESPSRVNKR